MNTVILILYSSIVLAPAAGWSQHNNTSSGRLYGQVFNASKETKAEGKPGIAGQEVVLYKYVDGKDEEGARAHVVTDKDGRFEFTGLEVGKRFAYYPVAIVTSMNNSHAVHDTKNYHPATYTIAEKFICGCPECDMELVNCDCNDSSGGAVELLYISERLKTGLSEEEVINNVYREFGRIKSKYQHLINEERSQHN